MRSIYKNKKTLYGLAVVSLLVATLYLALPNQTPLKSKAPSAGNTSATAIHPTGFNKNAYPTDAADSLWVIVNKGRALPNSYVPASLVTPKVPLRLPAGTLEMTVRSDTAQALEAMFTAAKTDGVNLQLTSGYRSYNEQISVYSGYVKSAGQAAADTYSARPGHSEHQTGLAADIEPTSRHCELDQCFGDTPEGVWLLQNSYKYGLIIRYQKNAQSLTGYEYEPWHVRFVGQALALQIHQSGQTLEQFFELPIYTDYPAQSLALKS